MANNKKRFKGRYISDEKYLYIQKQIADGVEEIVRIPQKELDVVEIEPNPARWNTRSKEGFINKNKIIFALYFGLPLFGIVWEFGVFQNIVVYILYWLLTIVFIFTTLIVNWKVLRKK